MHLFSRTGHPFPNIWYFMCEHHGMPVTIPNPSSVCSKELDMICIRNLDLKKKIAQCRWFQENYDKYIQERKLGARNWHQKESNVHSAWCWLWGYSKRRFYLFLKFENQSCKWDPALHPQYNLVADFHYNWSMHDEAVYKEHQ